MRVVADTNVYVSAIIFGGKPQAILDLAQDGQIELFISDAILDETTRILRDKFHRTQAAAERPAGHRSTDDPR